MPQIPVFVSETFVLWRERLQQTNRQQTGVMRNLCGDIRAQELPMGSHRRGNPRGGTPKDFEPEADDVQRPRDIVRTRNGMTYSPFRRSRPH